MTHCSQALNIPELLERILLHLPLHDLVLSERVCKLWQDSLGTSIKIRHALFRERMPQTTVTLVSEKTRGINGDKTHSREFWRTAKGVELDTSPIYNPLMNCFRLSEKRHYVTVEGTFTLKHVGLINLLNPEDPEDRPPPELEAFHRSRGSWRRMFVMQPAAQYL